MSVNSIVRSLFRRQILITRTVSQAGFNDLACNRETSSLTSVDNSACTATVADDNFFD
eukprot:m.635751 g.635751  ORF g.635751 m.635751 type:complete len:58 (+) comp22587_c0_seq13:4492-4665(+)